MTLSVTTLGGQNVMNGDRTVTWPSAAARDLFFMLLGHPAGQTREAIVETLWDSALTPSTRANFKVTLHRMKQALGDADAVTENQHTYALHPRYADAADETHFHAALGQMLRAESRADRLRFGYRAATLYSGDYLLAYGWAWAEERRDALRSEYVQLRLELAALHCGALECSAAIRNLGAGLASDPLTGEGHHQVLMTCLYTMGRTDDALTHFRHYAVFVQREVGDTLSDEMVTLADTLKSGRQHTARQIGGPLPCPRRALYGLSPRVTGVAAPLDLGAWAAELRRGQTLHAFATRLHGARSRAAFAQLVQRFFQGAAGVPLAALLGGETTVAPIALEGGEAWPSGAGPALAAACGLRMSAEHDLEESVVTVQGWRVKAVPLPGRLDGTPVTLCLGVPAAAEPAALEAELIVQAVATLRHVLAQPRWAESRR